MTYKIETAQPVNKVDRFCVLGGILFGKLWESGQILTNQYYFTFFKHLILQFNNISVYTLDRFFRQGCFPQSHLFTISKSKHAIR